MPIEREDKGIGQTAWSLQDRAAAARTAKDRNAVSFAGGQIDIIGHAGGAAQHDEDTGALPKPKHRNPTPFIQFVEQGFVQRKILDRQGKRQIEQAERGHVMSALE